MIKTKTDGHSEANTPLTHIFFSFIHLIQFVFLPPSVIIWNRSWWPLLLITFWHLGATVDFSPQQQKLRQLSVASTCTIVVLFPPLGGLNFIRQIFALSSEFVGDGPSDTAGRAYRAYSVAGRHEAPTRAGRHHGGHLIVTGRSHATPPAVKLFRVRYVMLRNVVS